MYISIIFDAFHLGLSLNVLASRNISVMSVTLDTSHCEISPSYDVAPLNMPVRGVVTDTLTMAAVRPYVK